MTIPDETMISNVLGRYTRAHDQRDPDALAALFAPEAAITIVESVGSADRVLARLEGHEAIHSAVRQMMAPHAERAWSQNVISAPLITVKGDEAFIDVQFMVFGILADPVPDGGWPAGTFGAQGLISPIEAGQYHAAMQRTANGWAISALRIEHRLPMAFG